MSGLPSHFRKLYRRVVTVVAFVCLFVAPAYGQLTVSFPTPGITDSLGFIPVRFTGLTGGAMWIELRAGGAVTTRVMLDGVARVDLTTKWLTFGPVAPDSIECVDSTGRREVVRTPEIPIEATSFGPGGAVEPRGYLPTFGWSSGTPYLTRRRVMLGAVALGIIALLVALAGPRSAWALAGVSVVVCGEAWAWDVGRDPVLQIVGQVVVREPRWETTDTWTYQSSNRATHVRFDVSKTGMTLPILADPEHSQRIGLALVARADGSTSFEYHLDADARVAFVHRSVRPLDEEAPFAIRTVDTPMKALARSLYAGNGLEIVGTVDAPVGADDVWPGIAIVFSEPLPGPTDDAGQK